MVAQNAPVSVAEYLTIEASSEIKREYVDGAVYAMAGGTLAHDRIANDVRTVMNAHLGAGPCALYGPHVRLRVSPTLYYYPDGHGPLRGEPRSRRHRGVRATPDRRGTL